MVRSASEGFWPALEALPGRAAVADEWQQLVGGAFDRVRPFLRVQPGRARWFPNPDGGLPYEVHEHADGDIVGVCPESGRTVPLTPAQLVVYELDRRRLGAAVAAALGIDATGSGGEPGPTTHLGRFVSAEVRYDCFLALPTESADGQVVATQLLAERGGPFVLFAPTRRWVRRAVESLLRLNGCAFVALSEAVSLSRPGQLVAARSLDAVLGRVTGAVSVGAAGDADRERNAFRLEGDVWALVFAGKRVGLADSLGLRYLAHLLGAKRRDVDAAVLKAAATGNVPIKPPDGFVPLDRRAWEECRSAYSDLAEQLEEAVTNNDVARQQRVREQMAVLADELQSTQGFGGRDRKKGDKAASMRTSIKNAIDRTLAILKDRHPPLHQHLDTSVTTGTTLRYDPVPNVEWDL